jgi:hypothetical protein
MFALLLAPVAARPSYSLSRMSDIAVDSLGRFPSVEGSSLEGEHFTLPADFKGGLNVVLVAFRREQQDDVDSWTPFLKTVVGSRPGVRVYELPTLGRRYRLMRPFIDGGMRRGIPDAAVRATTITLYIDKDPFRESLRLPEEDRIYVLLVDRQGKVYWRAEGRFEARSGAELVRRVDEALSTHGAGG